MTAEEAQEILKCWQDDETAARQRMVGARGVASRDQLAGLTGLQQMEKRSEERRVGKEC